MSDTTTQTSRDPAGLSLTELRELRQQLQHEDDVVSYARRVAQARLDLVKTELSRREAGPDANLSAQIEAVLSQHLTGGPARPPRPIEDLSGTRLLTNSMRCAPNFILDASKASTTPNSTVSARPLANLRSGCRLTVRNVSTAWML